MKRILHAVAVVGLSSVLVIILGALRAKAIAVGVGATGVGTLGILTAAANFGVVLFAVGMNTSGVQAVASAAADPAALRRVRGALLGASRVLALGGGVIVAAVALVIGALGSDAFTGLLAVALGVTVAAMVLSGAQLALINGLGRVRLLALSNALGALLGTIATGVALLVSPDAALIAALVATPVTTLACSTFLSWRLTRGGPRVALREWLPEVRGLVALGGMVMLGMAITNATQLVARLLIEGRFGLAEVGYFQAGWTITTLYMGFVLTALAAEYFPRISSHARDDGRINRSVDEQVRIALLLATPVLIWTITLAPLALTILYSSEFQEAAPLLQWQLVGDVFKVVGWAIAFLLLARKARYKFFFAELTFNAVYLALSLWALAEGDLTGFGYAYAGAYAVYAVVVAIFARRESGFRPRPATVVLALGAVAVALAACLTAQSEVEAVRIVGIVLVAAATAGAAGALVVMRRREQRTDLRAAGAEGTGDEADVER